MLKSSQQQQLQGPLAPACVGEQKEALFKLYHTFRCWRQGEGGNEREGERERCGPLLPVGEVIQTALNIKTETQNQKKIG